MDALSSLSRIQLIALCKERKVRGYSGKKKSELLALISNASGEQGKQGKQGKHGEASITNNDTYKVLSLFSGMGGMDIGFSEQVVVHEASVCSEFVASKHTIDGFVNLRRLPFVTVFQNDILPVAQKVAERNGWNHNYVLKDIRDLLKENYAFPHADVITGGFPCQDFSHAGKRKGLDTKRGTLYQAFVEVVKRVKPILFVAENVNGLLTMPGNPLATILADFSSNGYEVRHQLVKCEEYGIPQTRWRVIILGLRLDKRGFVGDDWHLLSENKRACPVKPYFAHLAEPSSASDLAQTVYSKAARLPKGQGQTEVLLNSFGPTMRAEHHGNIEFRRIVGGKNGEPDKAERRLTVREAALLQTFPPDCILTDVRATCVAYKPIGNAVPPLLGYLIGRKVASLLQCCQ